MNRRSRPAIAAVAAAWLGLVYACASAPSKGAPPDGCEFCTPDERCYSGAYGEGFSCVTVCDVDADCEDGHHCTTYQSTNALTETNYEQEERICSPYCSEELCLQQGDRIGCDGLRGSCRPVECSGSGRIPCVDPLQVCDATVPRCVSGVGQCDSVADCPVLDRRISSIAERECDAARGLCRVRAVQHASPLSYANPNELVVTQPEIGQNFPTMNDVVFEWQRHSDASIAVVLAGMPVSLLDMPRLAIWGASRPVGSDEPLRWLDGVAIVEGAWGGEPAPPGAQPLYLQLLGVRGGGLVAASNVIPFHVGSDGWLEPGSPCTDEGALPGSCAHPDIPMACRDYVCRRICLSNDDCACLGCSTQTCTLPESGIRVCE